MKIVSLQKHLKEVRQMCIEYKDESCIYSLQRTLKEIQAELEEILLELES